MVSSNSALIFILYVCFREENKDFYMICEVKKMSEKRKIFQNFMKLIKISSDQRKSAATKGPQNGKI